MKNKIVSVILAACMVTTLLTACGDSKGASAPASTTQTETPAPAAQDETETETADSADTDAISDEAFAALQDCYAAMVEHYNAVQELYSLDEIAADAEIEEVMTEAADVINEMGEITQDSITNDDALELIEAMENITDALNVLVDSMELADGEMVSDENFEILQENYEVLIDTYNAVVDAYNSGAFEADADFEDAMNEAAEVIEEMGTIEQDTLTAKDAETLNALMEEIYTALAEVPVDEK